MTDERKPIQSVSDLSERQRQALIADLLDFFTTEPEYPEARPIRDLAGDLRFDAYTMSVLKEMTRSMARSGSLYRPPHAAGRNSRYLTTREGRKMKDDIFRKLRR